ncbi:MAG: hypothetical protein ACI8ZN_000667 [Bacteroidia bacterium]|jgi:hypothetical protein
MKTTRLIGILLVAASLAIGYLGFNKLNNSIKEVSLLGLKIDATDESGQDEGYVYLGVAIFIFVGGVYLIKPRK